MKLRPGLLARRGVATPVFFGAGVPNQDISNDNLNAPANTLAGDICIICVHTAIGSSLTGNTGYAHVTGSPLSYSGSRLHVMWKRATSSSNNISSLDAVDGWTGVMVVLRGCQSIGTPFNAATTTTQGSTTALSHVGVVAAGSGNIVLLVTGSEEASATARYTGITNATLNAVTEQVDYHTSTPDPDGGIAVFSGTLAGSGATGTWTATRATASAMGHLSVAFGH